MGKVFDLISPNHPLVGVWQGDDDDARAQYKVFIKDGHFVVEAIDRYDGEVFEISNIDWDSDNEVLTFNSFMPSTGRLGTTCFKVLGKDQVEVEFSFTEKAVWVRADTEADSE